MTKISNRKEAILDAARELIDKIGPDKITMELIAKRIEMGKASIYYYFKSKEEIISEVASEEGKKIQRAVYKAIQHETNPIDKLKAYITTRVKHVKELAGYYGGNKLQKNLHKYYYDFESTLLQSIIEDGIEQDIFDIDNVKVTTDALLSGLRGIEYQWTFNSSIEEVIVEAEVLFNLLLNGIKKR